MSDEARFELRHGTQDQEVFEDVVVSNQYKLADSFPPDSLIIDIGANIGCFAVACLLRGADAVLCFEPCPDNFRQLGNNTLPWPGKVAAFNVAVWRSDKEEALSFHKGGGTAAGCCLPADPSNQANRVNSIGLTQIIDEATNHGERRVNLLKIDAEYSEYPILYTCTNLHLVDEIVGETHELSVAMASPIGRDCSAVGMKAFLESQGFAVEQRNESGDNSINTLFFANRHTPEKTNDPS